MQVNELTVEQLKALIRETVRETIEEFLTNPDANQTINDNLQQELLAIQEHTENGVIGNENITPPKTATATHPLDNFIETFGVWEDERTSEEIIEDIYNSRTISNTDYSL